MGIHTQLKTEKDMENEEKIKNSKSNSNLRKEVGYTADCFNFDNEYDPMKPNNYEVYLEERIRKHEEQKQKKDVENIEKQRKQRNKDFKQSLLENESKLNGKGRGNEMLIPAWMKNKTK